MKKICYIFIYLISALVSYNVVAQDRFANLENKLKVLAVESPGLEEKVDLSVNNVTIQDFIRGIAVSNKLNISVDPTLDIVISQNFSGTTVTDILLFLAKKYPLDILFIGNIISIEKYVQEKNEKPITEPRKLQIVYYPKENLLSMDLKNDTLGQVAKAIAKESGKNIVLAPSISIKTVSGFIEKLPFEKALESFCFANGFTLTPQDGDVFVIALPQAEEKGKNNSGNNSYAGNTKNINEKGNAQILVENSGGISVSGTNQNITELIREAAQALHLNHFFTSDIKGQISLDLKNVSFDEFLSYLFNGTDYTFKKINGIYILGERKTESLRATKVVQLQYRTSEKIIDYIPSELKKDLELKEFSELNSIVLSGSELKIAEIEKFLYDIDKVVPVVIIEVIIVDYKSNKVLSAGVKAGLGTEPAVTGGNLYPTLDMQLGSQSINELINSFNGFGLINIGKVTPNFYLSIKALEEQGIVRVRSTPKLAAISSHEATMSIGNTEYYLEENNNVIGSQNPQNIITRTYKSVNADLSITVKPFVSGDNQITLDIKVKQSDFTGRISQNAPPGSVSRNFSSMIRVKDQEMVLLGGLEEKKISDTGSGVPFLSRVPVIKWLFSNRTRQDSKTKLNIFIKPTVLY